MEPVVRCDTLKNMVQFFVEQKGAQTDHLIDGLSHNEKYYFDTSNWTSIVDLNRLAWNIHKLFPETTLLDWIKIGRYGSITKIGSIFQTIIPFLPLQYIYNVLPHISRNLYSFVSCEMVVVENGYAEMELRIDPRYITVDLGFFCFQFAGILSIFPQLRNLEPAKVTILYNQSKINNIVRYLYHAYHLFCEEKQDGFYIEGKKIGKPVFLCNETLNGKRNVRHGFSDNNEKHNAYLIDSDVIVNNRRLFKKGELYNAPYSKISFEWQRETLKERLVNSLRRKSAGRMLLKEVSSELHLAEKKFKEEDAARVRAEIAEKKARAQADRLEALVAERTHELEKTHEKLVEIEKRVLEKQITSGFASEMENALTKVEVELQRVRSGQGGDCEICSAIGQETIDILEEFLLLCEKFDVPNDFVKDTFVHKVKNIATHSIQLNSTVKNISQDLERTMAITRMLADYAQLSDIQPGTKSVDLAEVLAQYQKKYQIVLKENNITFTVSGLEQARIKADPHHIYSVFSNLIGNSLDALTERAQVEKNISVDIGRDIDGKMGFVVTFCDNGMGVEAEIREEVFKPFFTTKPSTGTGLGLAIVERLVDLYGGNLSMESIPGEGTCVKVLFLVNTAG